MRCVPSSPVRAGEPCMLNSLISMRWPLRRARSRPPEKAMPSTMERTPRSSIFSVPCSWGDCSVPLSAIWVSSVPRRRQPGGANIFHTPTRGSLACSWPLKGALPGRLQPDALRCSRVRTWALALPARALSQSRRASIWLPLLCTSMRALRMPAATRPPWPDRITMSPLLRAKWACSCRRWPSSTFQAPSSSILLARD